MAGGGKEELAATHSKLRGARSSTSPPPPRLQNPLLHLRPLCQNGSSRRPYVRPQRLFPPSPPSLTSLSHPLCSPSPLLSQRQVPGLGDSAPGFTPQAPT